MTEDIKYWLAIAKIPKIGPAKFKKLCAHFPSMKEAWQADAREWTKAGLDKETVSNFYLGKNQIDKDQLLEDVINSINTEIQRATLAEKLSKQF